MALQHASRHDPPWLDLQAIEAWAGGQRIVEDLSLRLWVGESTAILGPNGSGKSTLVKLISRCLHPVVQPHSYLRLFGEERINLWSLREHLGVVDSELQQRIPDAMTCRELMHSAFFGAIGLGRGHHCTQQQVERSADVLEQFSLSELASSQFGSLSDGQKRRMLIARAMVHQPQVLVLDEPFDGLESSIRDALERQLERIGDMDTSLIMVTHHPEDLPKCMTHALVIDDGKIVRQGRLKRRP